MTILKREADVLHLWFGRRAATRIRSELMSAIHDKALKRKDFSGIINKNKDREDEKKDKEDEKKAGDNKGHPKAEGSQSSADNTMSNKSSSEDEKDKKAKREAKEKADNPKTGADVGKIVNLMAGDANRVRDTDLSSYYDSLRRQHTRLRRYYL